MIPAARRYAQAQRETASPERLMVLLFEAALRNIRTGATALEHGRSAEASQPLLKASDIVVELHATLDRSKAPDRMLRRAASNRSTMRRSGEAVSRWAWA